MEALKSSLISTQPIKDMPTGKREKEEIKRLRDTLLLKIVTTQPTLRMPSPMLSQHASALTSPQRDPLVTTLKSKVIPPLISRKTSLQIIVKILPLEVKQNQRTPIRPMSKASHHSSQLHKCLPRTRWLHINSWWTPALQSSNQLATLLIQVTSRWCHHNKA